MVGCFNSKNRQVVSSNLKLVLQMSEVMVLHLGGIKWTNFILSSIFHLPSICTITLSGPSPQLW